MKQRITIANAALNFLHGILSSTGVVSKADARKQNTTFKCMEKHVIAYREAAEALKSEYKEEETVEGSTGAPTKRWIIPEKKLKEFQDKLVAIENTKVAVDFDVESFSVMNRAFDGLFERQAALKDKGESDGIKNETTMKLIEEAASALESATKVD